MAGLSWRDYRDDADGLGLPPTKGFLTLNADTDPFSVLEGGERYAAWARWVGDLFHRFYPGSGTVHLRRIHYRLVSSETPIPMVGSVDQGYEVSPIWIVPRLGKKRPGEKAGDIRPNTYENTDDCWQRLAVAAKWARHLGFIDGDLIVDNRSPDAQGDGYRPAAEPTPGFFTNHSSWEFLQGELTQGDVEYFVSSTTPFPSVPERPQLWARSLRNGTKARQTHHLEIWVEKSTMNDVLLPICQRHGIVLQSLVGESSLTRTADLLRRIQANGGRPCRVLYLSDFDPGGNSMPAAASRRIEHLIRSEDPDLDVQVTHLLLTKEQVEQYGLPTIPIKETEVRADKFRERQDTDGAVELDALEAIRPGELARLVEEAIQPYLDADADWQEALDAYEAELDEQADAVNDAMEEVHGAALDQALKEFDDLRKLADARYALHREASIRDLRAWEAKHGEAIAAAYQHLRDYAPEVDPDDLPEPELVDEPDPLLDSAHRDYFDQLIRYRRHKGINS